MPVPPLDPILDRLLRAIELRLIWVNSAIASVARQHDCLEVNLTDGRHFHLRFHPIPQEGAPTVERDPAVAWPPAEEKPEAEQPEVEAPETEPAPVPPPVPDEEEEEDGDEDEDEENPEKPEPPEP